MTRFRLTNEQWGFTSNCFVCEPTNAFGLRIPFWCDADEGVVIAEPTFGPEHSGAPTYVHGGVQLAVLDEAMAWATIGLARRFAVTADFQASFAHPVRVGRPYRVEARLTAVADDRLEASGVIVDAKDRPCTTATAQLVVLSAAQAVDAIGADVDATIASYVRGGTGDEPVIPGGPTSAPA